MKIIKAVLPILFAVITVTSCTRNISTEQANSTQVVGTAISSPFPTEGTWNYEYVATVPIASVSNSTQEKIASLLFTQWLNHFKTEEADLDHRLEDFELVRVVIYEKKLPDEFVAMVSFSVKPTKMSSWVAGNGISTDNIWVRKKLLFIRVKKEKDSYRLVSMGTGP